jgi:hypothetical protein
MKLSLSGNLCAGFGRRESRRSGMLHRLTKKDMFACPDLGREAGSGYVSGRMAGILRLLDDRFSLHSIHVKSAPD